MKKYVSCVILIVLCIICAMIFYVHAKNNDDSIINGNSNTNTSTGSSDTTANGEPIEDVNIIEIEKSGTFLSEAMTDYALRLEWAVLKYESDENLYISTELYLDYKTPLNQACSGYLMVNGEKKEFTASKLVSGGALLTSVSKVVKYTDNTEIKLEGFLDVDILTASGISLDSLRVNGTVLALSEYGSMPKEYLIDFEHMSQFPDLPSGDEVTSLAMVLKHLGYNVDKCELCDLYLDKGPVGFTDFNVANVGNPRDVHNSYGCMPSVIVKACNRYITVNGGSYSAYDISGYNIDAILREVSLGNPVIVWTCEDFDITPSISRIWVVDGKNVYLKSNMATMVLVGYDLINNTVTLSNPAGNQFTVDLDLFTLRFSQLGAGAVIVKQ